MVSTLELEFSGVLLHWRGPAPWYFVPVPEEESLDVLEVSTLVTYGWGVIPVTVRIGSSVWETSLFPKDGRYLVPVKAAIRDEQRLEEGDRTDVHLTIRDP
jgi:hypothetical protein